MEILCIIPARGGSKGIKDKNLKELCGKPLIAHVIIAAKESKYISRIIVSTDSARIKAVGISYGAEVPFLRPKYLAADTTPLYKVIKHTLSWANKNNYSPELIVMLQPTSPLLSSSDIDSSIDEFLKSGAESLVSVTEAEHSPYWMVKLKDKNRIEPIIQSDYFYLSYRQGLPQVYRLNGAIYVTFPSTIKKYSDLFHPDMDIVAYIMPKERSLDINTEFELNLARYVFCMG